LNKTAMLLEGQEQWINFQNETHHWILQTM
jgi:hypothetical protein